MAEVPGHFFDKNRSVFPLQIMAAETILRRVASLNDNLDKLIEVRGDKDGKTVKGAEILQRLQITLREILKPSMLEVSQVSIKDNTELDGSIDVLSSLGPR